MLLNGLDMLENEKIYFVSSERGWSRSLSPHPAVNSLRNSEDKDDVVPKPSNEAELSQPPVLPPRQQAVLVTSSCTVPEVPFEAAGYQAAIPPGAIPPGAIPPGDDFQPPPPLPPRLPGAAPGSKVSRNAMLDVGDMVSGNNERYITAEKSKPNVKLGQSDSLQHNNNALLLGANLNPPQFIRSQRLENRDNGSSWEVKRESEELQWDDAISFQRPKNHEAGLVPPLIGYSPTPWGTRDLESRSSFWDRSQCARSGATDEDSHSAELLPPGLFSSPRARSKKESLQKGRDGNGVVETRETDTQVAR